MLIVIEQKADNLLSKKVFTFYVSMTIQNKPKIYLNEYSEQSKKTKRSKYKIDKKWNRLDTRYNNFQDEVVLSKISQDIMKQVKDELKKQIDDIYIGI